MDRHYLLEKFEDIYKKYDFPENEYKTFVEALGGKKEEPDFKNAKIVKLEYIYQKYQSPEEFMDEYEADSFCDNSEPLEFKTERLFCERRSQILEVQDGEFASFNIKKILRTSNIPKHALEHIYKVCPTLKDFEHPGHSFFKDPFFFVDDKAWMFPLRLQILK